MPPIAYNAPPFDSMALLNESSVLFKVNVDDGFLIAIPPPPPCALFSTTKDDIISTVLNENK